MPDLVHPSVQQFQECHLYPAVLSLLKVQVGQDGQVHLNDSRAGEVIISSRAQFYDPQMQVEELPK